MRIGGVFVEVYDYYGSPEGAITFYKLPIQEWCRLVINFMPNKVKIVF